MKSQIHGIVDCDPNTTPQSLELYQQIFDEQGMINEAEASLLATMGEVDEEEVKDWCKSLSISERYLLLTSNFI